jgi:cytochrome c-type biogenesis protein CcmH/NrfF
MTVGVVALLLTVAGWSSAAAVAAQDGTVVPRRTASEEVARKAVGLVRSPYCPGLMLEVCPSAPAEILRDSMRALAAEGMTVEELVEWMIAGHGEEWRALPKRSGAGLWAWLLPPAVLLFGVGVVATRLRGIRNNPVPHSPAVPMSDDDRERLVAALAELERTEAEEEAE